MRSADEVIAYLERLRLLVQYLGASDCKLQEGSMRADVNLSVREVGTETFGTRTEMKNLNSFQYVRKAIEYEFKRQVDTIEAGEEIVQETRRFDEKTGKTFSMRKKEDANDYRYFPDPDLAPIELSESTLSSLQSEIPALPDQRKAQYIRDYLLTPYDAEMLTAAKYGFLMENGSAPLRTKVPFLAPPHTQAGVMQVLHRVLAQDGWVCPADFIRT